jgi:cytochrome bd ubiquinol oxidase subunit I
MDVVLLSRIQFALTIAFHYIFPPMSIGLGLLLVFMEGMYLKTRDPLYERMTRFWVKVFGLIFAIGVASGIVMEFQFGTNWSTYSRFVGDVFGSPLAAEGVFAFFLESGFLAVLLFGWDRVSPRWHFFATVMVALGAHLSALWIVVANSWQQTPAGHHVVLDAAGRPRAEIVDFWAMVWNPSTVDRLSHVYMGAWQAGAFLVLSVSAWYLLKRRHEAHARAAMKLALVLAVVASLGQLATGHRSAITVAKHQPAKLAAFEGHYPRSAKADMYLFGWVDEQREQVTGVRIPGLLSFLVHCDAQQPVTGLQAFEQRDRPPVNATFQSYHLMVIIGMGLIGLSLLGLLLWLWRGRLFETRWLLWAFVPAFLGPQLANQLGWFSAEVGRQPWIVYGLLRTGDAASKAVKAPAVIGSIVMFSLIYLLLLGLFVVLMLKKIQAGPAEPVVTEEKPA